MILKIFFFIILQIFLWYSYSIYVEFNQNQETTRKQMTERTSKTPYVEIFTTQTCPYCVKAKKLLDQKGIAYTAIDLTNDEEGRISLIKRANGRRTVPQIFIEDYHVGGCDDLYALNESGELYALLLKLKGL